MKKRVLGIVCLVIIVFSLLFIPQLMGSQKLQTADIKKSLEQIHSLAKEGETLSGLLSEKKVTRTYVSIQADHLKSAVTAVYTDVSGTDIALSIGNKARS